MRKVKAHLSYRDVQDGHIDFIDWMGNQAADAEARKGVRMHPDNRILVEQANQLRADQLALCQYFAHINARLQHHGLSEQLYAAHSPATEALLTSTGPPLRGGGPVQEGIEASLAPIDPRGPAPPHASLLIVAAEAGQGNAASVEASYADDRELPLPQSGDQDTFHAFDSSHHLYRTTNYVFCAVCCVYAKVRSIRISCKLRVRCCGEAPSHNARRVRDRLMIGTEPGTPLVVTGSLAVRLHS